MGSIMDQERPWNKEGYNENPSYLTLEEEMKRLREYIISSSKTPQMWNLSFNSKEKNSK
jgi:hypothetical protein